MKKINQKDLQIGDVVILANNGEPLQSAGNQMTVINRTDKEITFFRPYVSLADFTYTGGVIPYVGMEKFSVPFGNPSEYFLIENIFRPSEAEKRSNCGCKGTFHEEGCKYRVS